VPKSNENQGTWSAACGCHPVDVNKVW